MKTKIKGNLLLNADVIVPELAYATFSDSLTMQTKKEISLILDYGHEILQCYAVGRDNLHVANVTRMLERMEGIYRLFAAEMYAAQRSQEA